MDSTEKKHRHIETLFYGIVLFTYLYEFQIIGTPSLLSSRKIAFAIIAILFFLPVILNKKAIRIPFKRTYMATIVFITFIIGYLLFFKIIYTDISSSRYVLPRVVYFLLYGIIGSVMFTNKLKSIKHFYDSVIIATLIQSTIVYAQFISPSARQLFSKYFVDEGNVSFLRDDRVTGLATANGAMLSMLIFLGLFACGYYLSKEKKIKWGVIYLYLLFSIPLVARTGFYVAILYSILVVYLSFRGKITARNIFFIIKMFVSISLVFSILLFVGNKYIDLARIEYLVEWVASLWRYGLQEQSAVHLSSMVVPELTTETLIGTGVFRGVSANGTIIQHDSGYVQSYFSMGLIIAILFYLIIYNFMFKLVSSIKDKSLQFSLFFFLLVIIVLEVKEPFVLAFTSVFFLVVSSNLVNKKNRTLNQLQENIGGEYNEKVR